MTVSDTLHALEAGLITEAEATEQALVDRLDELYARAADRRPRRHNLSSAAGQRQQAAQ
jgi:hypothetical protein